MYLVCYHLWLEEKDLHKPSKSQYSLIKQAEFRLYKESNFLPNVKWYILKREWGDHTKGSFAGVTTKLSKKKNILCESDPYAICVASYVFGEKFEYIIWLLKHELRHCKKVGNSMFRPHDIELIDEGNDLKRGFFNEDWKEISCCDVLMSYHKECGGIERYL